MAPVMRGDVCCGFLLRRFNTIEAFDAEAVSIGIFQSEAEAAQAVINLDNDFLKGKPCEHKAT
jgi:hypothetical protein